MKLFRIASVLLTLGCVSLPISAYAQDLSVRTEAGLAIPLEDPQATRFTPGGEVALKPELTLGHIFSFGPSLSFVFLPSTDSDVDTGTALGVGGFLRFKRPHDWDWNPSKGAAAVSPWIDADLQYVRTDMLNRLGWDVGAGVSFPVTDERTVWIGPYARYQTVYQDGNHPGFDTTDAKLFTFGLTFEFGGEQKRPLPPVEPPVTPVKPKPAPTPPPPPVIQDKDVNMEVREVIQFAWDSSALDDKATGQLAGVVKQLDTAKKFDAIRVEGHASSEGQVEHNDKLSLKRAQAVVDFLVAHGVPKDKLTATGFGSKEPVATNKTEPGRVLNRRAEFVVRFVIVVKEKVSK